MKVKYALLTGTVILINIGIMFTGCQEEREETKPEAYSKTTFGTDDIIHVGTRQYIKRYTDENGDLYEIHIKVDKYYDTDAESFFTVRNESVVKVNNNERAFVFYNANDTDNPIPGNITIIDANTRYVYVSMPPANFDAELVPCDDMY